MMSLAVIFLITVLAATYAYSLRQAEVRRQEWRRESRATWIIK
jgi:hypothetical protein